MLKCSQRTQGGKGNLGKFIERDPKVFAAGRPTKQADETVADHLKYYLLKDEVDALIHDAIIPESEQYTYLPKRPPKHRDMRNAGIFTDGRELINPPINTKFKELVQDFKNTIYSSYWKKPVGCVPDQAPMLPRRFNTLTTTLGKKLEHSENLYDVVMPKVPIASKDPPSKEPGYQIERNYCGPAFDSNKVYGKICNPDKRGKYMKCCMTDDRVKLGSATYKTAKEANFNNSNKASLAKSKTPNDNINCVPPGFAFGILKPPDNLPECLTTCELNPGRQDFKKCLAHLNTLRKCLSKRVNASFFHMFFLNLTYFDKLKVEWLPKEIVYDLCATRHVRFNPSLIEPLLEIWGAFDGSKIKYKTFVRVINHREPSPTLPKIYDVPDACHYFTTTYREMVKPGQTVDENFRAGLPSGRYFDLDNPVVPLGYCKADLSYLPDESDAMSCLSPSTLTLCGVNHRDMFAKRSPELVRKVFEASGETFSDKKFNEIWEKAQTYHSQGWVSFGTFRNALLNDVCN